MGQVNWTGEALSWLKDIHDYIANDDPEAPQRVVLGILDKAQVLPRFPHMGYRYEGEEERDVRILLYGALPYRLSRQA